MDSPNLIEFSSTSSEGSQYTEQIFDFNNEECSTKSPLHQNNNVAALKESSTMDSSNLIEFSSPVAQESSTIYHRINRSTSPGSNPFDSLCKNIITSSEGSQYTEQIFDFNNEECSTKSPLHQNNNVAALKESVEKTDCSSQIQESDNLCEMNPPDASQDASQVIPCKNASDTVCTSPKFIEHFFYFNNDVQNVGRESLAFLKDIDISGRESLGILKLEMLNASFDSMNIDAGNGNSPNIFDTYQKSKDFISPLNTAFLQPLSSSNISDTKCSGSSLSSNPSFNSASLDASALSKIYSINFGKHFEVPSQSKDFLNVAFVNSVRGSLKFSNTDNSLSNPTSFIEEKLKNRKVSLPEFNNKETEVGKRICYSESGAEAVASVDLEETDNAFNNSVFIEANHFASKIADGSILLGDHSVEENLLDCTSPPSFEDMEANDSCEVKIDSETVFKVIDKMLPVHQELQVESGVKATYNSKIQDFSPYNNAQESNLVSKYNSPLKNELKHNLSSIFNGSQRHSSSSSNSEDHCKNFNELLQNLSAIIHNENRDVQQNIQGQQLLFSLADILCCGGSKMTSKSKCDHLDDSGHSSIEQEDQQNEQDVHECYEVLDLRLGSKSQDNEQVLDLSMKSKDAGKRLSQSFSFPAPKIAPANLFTSSKGHAVSASSASNLEHSKSGPDPAKLKPKKPEDRSSSRKGPLKAIIPLGNMSKRKSIVGKIPCVGVTPPKVEQPNSSVFKLKRTSTPIIEQELKPVAQSTPDDLQSAVNRNRPISCSSDLKKRRFYCPVSPLVRPSSISDASINSSNKSNRSGSAPNLSNHSGNSRRDSSIPASTSLYRRHSSSELKANNNKAALKRSYSIGTDHKANTIAGKLKQNVSIPSKSTSSGTFKSTRAAVKEKKSVLQEKNTGIAANIRSLNLFGKLKKSSIGKENLLKKSKK